jgi:hypothetical protein
MDRVVKTRHQSCEGKKENKKSERGELRAWCPSQSAKGSDILVVWLGVGI